MEKECVVKFARYIMKTMFQTSHTKLCKRNGTLNFVEQV